MTLDWTTRGALRLYPQRWRDEFEQEVAGTLLDVAEAEQRRRPRLSELVPLAARGAWLRARTSVVFWVGLVIIAVMLWGVSQSFDGFVAERSWAVMLSRAGMGLMLALPLAAGSAAWQAGRRRTQLPLPQHLKNLGMDAAGPAAFVALGYATATIAQIAASGWPVTASLDARAPLAYLCMLLVSLSVGSLFGTLITGRIAAPLAWLALTAWLVFPWSPSTASWRSLTGSELLQGVPTLYQVASGSTVITTSVAALAVAALSVALIAVKLARGWRWVAVLLVLAGAATAVNAEALTGYGSDAAEARSATDTVCAGEAPRICLWPEQEAQAGELVRGTITEAYARAVAIGVDAPSTVSVANTAGESGLFYRLSPNADRLLTNYAQSLMLPYSCAPSGQVATIGDVDAQFAAEFAAAIVLGADPEFAKPVVQTGGDASEPATRTLTLAEIEDRFDVHSMAEAEVVVLAWVARGPTCG